MKNIRMLVKIVSLLAVRQWQFAPAKPHGTPVPMKVELPVLAIE